MFVTLCLCVRTHVCLCVCEHVHIYVCVLLIPLFEAWHVSCMTRFAACGAVVVTPEQHKNGGCYSSKMATTIRQYIQLRIRISHSPYKHNY